MPKTFTEFRPGIFRIILSETCLNEGISSAYQARNLRESTSYRDGGPKWHTARLSFEDAMHTLLTLLFAVAGGLTLSGIVTDLYWLVARPTKSAKDGLFYWVVMAIAGPTVLIENSTRSFISKKAAPLAYMTVLALSICWAFVMGLFSLAVYNVI